MDRSFLELAMPKIDALFSYRIIDASSFWQFGRVRRPEQTAERYALARTQMAGQHRVLGDIHNTVNLLRVFDGLDPVPFTST
jgi:oligoribonuclease